MRARVISALLLLAPACSGPPRPTISIDAGEITDKGYINQRAVLERRAAIVERLYRNPPYDEVIVLED